MLGEYMLSPTNAIIAEAIVNLLRTPFPTNQGISNCSLFEDLNFLPYPLELVNDVEFNPFSPLKESNRALDTFPEQLALSLLYEQFLSNFAPSTDNFGAGTSVQRYPATDSAI
jgi:hypothetical protein